MSSPTASLAKAPTKLLVGLTTPLTPERISPQVAAPASEVLPELVHSGLLTVNTLLFSSLTLMPTWSPKADPTTLLAELTSPLRPVPLTRSMKVAAPVPEFHCASSNTTLPLLKVSKEVLMPTRSRLCVPTRLMLLSSTKPLTPTFWSANVTAPPSVVLVKVMSAT